MANTYWVEFEWYYKILLDGELVEEKRAEACRFLSPKKSLKKAVKKYVHEEMEGEKYKGLKVNITDAYITTDYEI